MYKYFTRMLLLVAFMLPFVAQAQSSCTIKIVGEDGYADGWNGGYLSIIQNGTSVATFNAANADNDGEGSEQDSTNVTVSSDSPVYFVWSSGSYDYEVTIWIYNSSNQMVFTVSNPDEDTIFILNSPCSQFCSQPVALAVSDAAADELTLSWTPSGSESSWIVSNGTNTYVATDTFYTFYNLTANTIYNLSVRALCGTDDTSAASTIQARTDCSEGSCSLQIVMHDSYGDGWNGDAITGYLNGSENFTATLSSGSYGTYEACMTDNDQLTLVWTRGSYPSETSFEVNFGSMNMLSGYGSNFYTGDTVFTTNGCPSCFAPSNLTLDSVTTSEVFIHWTQGNDETSWLVSINNTDFETSNSTSFSLSDLAANTQLNIYVASLCSNGDTSLFVGPLSVRTLAGDPIDELPYICTFESASSNADWVIDNGSYTNGWYIGAAVNATTGGDSALYVSSDQGATNDYSTSSISNVVAYATFSLQAGEYHLSFDWLGYGESCCDYIRVGLVPASEEVVSGSSTFPSGTIEIANKLNLSSTWQNYASSFVLPNNGAYKLVFLWHNDGSVGTSPAGAIDNINFSQITCPLPFDLVCNTAAVTDSVVVSWNGGLGNSSWQLVYGASGFNANDDTDPEYNEISVSDTTYTFTTLSEGVAYDVYVRSDCSGDISELVGPVTFTPGQFFYTMPISGSDTIYTCNVVVTDDGGVDNSYSSNCESSLYLYPNSEGMALLISGTSQTESSYDYLEIVDLATETQLFIDNQSSNYSEVTVGPFVVAGGVKIRFHSDISVTYAGFQLNVSCIDVSCPWPTGVQANAVNIDSAYVSWTNAEGASNYNVAYGPAGFNPDTVQENILQVNGSSVYVGGLVSGQTYEFYVRTDCGSSSSFWQGPVSVTPGIILMPTSGEVSVTTCGALIVDDGGINGNYSNSVNSTMYVYPSNPDKTIVISGSSNTESCCDYVRVYEGIGTTGNLLFNGQGEVTVDSVSSMLGPVTIIFHSDGSVIRSGFELTVSCADLPECYAPVSNISHSSTNSSSATITWDVPTSTPTQYIIEYGPRMFQLGNGTVVISNTNSVTVNGLNPMAPYQAYIKYVCSSGDTSIWSMPYEFAPQCGAISQLPLVVGFDEYYVSTSSYVYRVPNCWAVDSLSILTGSNMMPALYRLSYNGNMALYLEEPTVVALPEMGHNLDSLMVSFDMSIEYDNMALVVGVVSSQAQGFGTSFQPVDTLYYSDNGRVNVYLANYSGSDRFIAFKNIVTDLADDYSAVLIDSLVIDYMPSCLPVSQLRITGNTATDVTIDWNDVVPGSSWQVCYGTSPLSDPTTGTSMVVTSHPVTITGLSSLNTYYFYVRNICSSTDNSEWRALDGGIIPGTWIMRPNQVDTVYMCGGTIFDDGGPNDPYSNSQNSSVIIMPDSPNNIVSVYGTSYTEGSWDYVTIYDGVGTSGTVLWTDNGISSQTNFGPFESTTGPITVAFHSDGSVTYSGFQINVECVSTSCRATNLRLDSLASVTSSSIPVRWNAPAGGAMQYQIEYGLAGFSHGNGSMLTTTSTTAVISGLSSTTTYDVYVRSICTGADTGSWVFGTFTTAMCDNFTEADNFESSMTETTSSYSPIGYSYYNNGYVQTIIPANRLSSIAGDINAIAFLPANTTAGSYFTGMSVWLANVSESEFTDGFIVPDNNHTFVQVISDADFSYSEADWQVQGFDSVFSWDGQSNILVSVVRAHGSYSSGAQFVAHSDTVARMCYAYSDYTSYTPDNPGSGYTSTTVGDIKLISCGGGCPRPTTLYASNISYASATLNWSGNANSYEVAVKPATVGTWPAAVSTGSSTSYNASGLTPATTYQFRVRAICEDDVESDWVVANFTTDSLPCMAPSNLTVSSVNFTSVTLNWTNGGNENQWRVRVWNTNFDTSYVVSSHPATVGGLEQSLGYHASVSSICGNGATESEASNEVDFTTATCETVQNLQVSNVTGSHADLTWEGSSSSYEVDYGVLNHGQGTGTVVVVNGNSYTINGLEPENQYSVFVRAICEPGIYGPWSQQVDFITTDQAIDIADANNGLTIYPNPASGNTTIKLSGVNGEVTISIVDMNGRVVKSESMGCESDCAKRIEVNGLAQGAYFVRVSGENINMVKKLVVK